MKKIHKKVLGKFFIALLVLFGIINFAIPTKNVKAKNIGDTAYLERDEKGYYTVQRWIGNRWSYIIYSITNYIDENGVKRVAYCVNPELNGIGYIDGEFEGYDVEVKNYLNDERLWRIYTNGYPYKSPSDMGVEYDEDAYLATKQAAYCIIKGIGLEEVRTVYRAGEDPIDGQDLEETNRRGQKIVDAMYNLVNIGYNGTKTMQQNNIVSIEQVGNITVENNNKEYYSVNYKINSSVECRKYIVKSIDGFPEGSFVANIKGDEQYEFSENDLFKIMIPKKNIKDEINGRINVAGECKNYPIFYAEAVDGNYQNYVLCIDEYSNNIEANSEFKLDVNKCKLQIIKTDKDSQVPIEGVKFSVKYKDEDVIGEFTTNKEGRIIISNLKPGEIIVKEIESNKDYVIDSKEASIKLEFDEFKTLKLTNELKKGSIKIIKVDSQNIETRIPGVKFEIYDENQNFITEVTTNENGEAFVANLPINKQYIIKEVETNEQYELSNDIVTIKLDENEIKSITFKNKKKENEKKTLPRTGSNYSNLMIHLSLTMLIVLVKLIK